MGRGAQDHLDSSAFSMSADGPASAEAVKHVLAAWAIAPPDDERTDALVTHTLEEHLKNTATGSRFAGRLVKTEMARCMRPHPTQVVLRGVGVMPLPAGLSRR